MKSAIGALVVLTAAACAPAPESIEPAYMSEMAYRAYSCEQLGEEQARLNEALAAASVWQSTVRKNDITGVILIRLPVASLKGQSVAPQISIYKGQLAAVHRALINNGCRETTGIQATPPVVSPATREPAWLPAR